MPIRKRGEEATAGKMNWHDLLPRALAIQQIAWERKRAVRRMHDLGMTYREIGARLGICTARAQQLAADRWRSKVSPAQQWLETTWRPPLWGLDGVRRLTLADVAKQH